MTKQFNYIGRVIISVRDDKNLTQEQLAVVLGYKNGQFISNVERGLSSISAKAIPVLWDKLGVSKLRVVNAMVKDYEANLKTTVGLV